ncbi:MAG: hypothetical protein FJ304_13635 [Planctomycetes bacterium]|nr:hypothetical protein [Planctomycetota bacterium]
MPSKQQFYRFTIGPKPAAYPAREVEAIGTFTAYVPADCPFGDFLSELSEQLPFETPQSAFTGPPVQMLKDGTPVGKLGLAVGDEVVLSGYSQFVMRLDSIGLAIDEEAVGCAFDLSGFDVDRMHEAVEDADADAGDVDVPVYRVQFCFSLQDRASGKLLNTLREARLRGDLSLGLLAAIAVDQSEGLLDLSTLTLSVGPANAAEGRLNYAGGDFEAWRETCLHELGVEPTPIKVVGTRHAADWQEVRGWTVTILPPQSGVIGQVTAAVMSNGDYWKLRSRS